MKWQQMHIGDFVATGEASIQTGPFGTQLAASSYVEHGIPVINVRNIGYGTLRAEKLEFVNDSTADRLSVHALEIDDIVFGRKGAVDRHYLVNADSKGWIQGSDCIRLRLASDRVLAKYVSLAFLSSTHLQWMLTQSGNKATMASLNQDIIKRIPITVPPLPTQRRMAEILSAYDDLIENNQRRMKLLEESARLLYEEWFVRLRFPGHEHTKIIDGVPEGWSHKRLCEIAEINAASLKSGFAGRIDYIDISSVSPGSINEVTPYEFSDAPGRARRIVRHGDTLWSCVRPNRRSFALVWNPGEGLIASTGFAVLSPRTVPSSFLYYASTTDSFVGFLEKSAKGGAYPAVVAADFERAMLLVPGAKLLSRFHEGMESIFQQRWVLEQECRRLRTARDLLLPRLMNGEIEV